MATLEFDRKKSVVVGAADIEPEADIQGQLTNGDSAAGASERDQRGVGLILENLAAAVGDTAINRIAAHDRIGEAVVNPEFESQEQRGKEGFQAAETATMSLADRFRELASESASCTKEFLDCGYVFAGELRQAKSPAAAVEVQIDFVQAAYVRLLDHFMKLSGLYWNLIRQSCNAAETAVAKVKC